MSECCKELEKKYKKLKYDVCYLHNALYKLNQKINQISEGPTGPTGSMGDTFTGFYNGSINLDTLLPSNKEIQLQNSYQTYIIQKNLAYTPGQEIIFAHDSDHLFISLVISYNSLTGEIILDVQYVIGNGTYSTWDINLSGSTGPTGNTGPTGDEYATTSSNTINLNGLSGIQTYTIGTNLAYTVGQEVTFGNSSTDYFNSIIDSYDSGNGAIAVTVQDRKSVV